jgi:UvrD-like helicase C-terminal domain
VPGWSPPFETGTFEYRLTKNCRNTRPVAEKVAAVFGGEVKTNKVEGPKPKFHVVGSSDAALQRVLDRLAELLREGVEPTQIQVLSTTWKVADRLRGRDVDGVGLVAYGEDGIAVETVQRYKGLEAEVVIVVIPVLADELDRSLVYTGLSRAQTFLEVVGPEVVMKAVGWGSA